MKKLTAEYEFSPEQLEQVQTLARAVGILPATAAILYARGMDTEEKMRAFLAPSKEHFLPPELMSGMKEAVALLTQARDEGWNVAVFGDYDADGIGACAVLSRALREFGIEPYLYVPERSEGYGLSIAAIDAIFDEFLPDLIVTVDCGISCAKEVEYIKELGAYVIVTDHHELPEVLPDCVCINPKFSDGYPYDNLCGAGVAFKLATALIGEKAYGLLDFCALSTVADSVPLLGENRDIVAEGLKRIAARTRPALSALLGKTEEITAQTLAFTLAPRVNAAGRMGDARAALRLFTTENEEEILPLAEKLNLYNSERQKLCDELYETARAEIRKNGAYGNVVMAMGENWHPGLVGIVAARIAEEFSRPALLFVKRGDMLRGSARSIENVNIYEALRACSEYIEEFGGHAQAAGVNVKAENFDALKEALDGYIGDRYTDGDFVPALCISGEEPSDLRTFARELNMLEPFGVGNRRPLFAFRAERLNASLLKPSSPHVTVAGGSLEFMYFGGAKELRLLKSDVPKTLVYEYNLSKFRGREYLKGFVRAVVYDGRCGNVELDAFENAVLSLKAERMPSAERIDAAAAEALLCEKRKSRYGLCVVARSREAVERFPSLSGMPVDVFTLSSGSVRNTVLLAPEPNADLSAFRDVVFLEAPAAVSQNTGDARVYAVNGVRQNEFSGFISREELLAVYAALKNAGGVSGESLAEAAKNSRSLGFPPQLFVFALAVFLELGLAECSDGTIRIVRGAKSDLQNSAIYRGAQRSGERG